VAGHRAGHGAADVVVVAERLDEGNNLTVVEDGDGAAHIRQMSDAAS